jgi:LysM repeat protein
MTQIVVQPGQTLWSLASATEPAADTQVVVQQIIDANALGGTSLRAGQLLWVPRG